VNHPVDDEVEEVVFLFSFPKSGRRAVIDAGFFAHVSGRHVQGFHGGIEVSDKRFHVLYVKAFFPHEIRAEKPQSVIRFSQDIYHVVCVAHVYDKYSFNDSSARPDISFFVIPGFFFSFHLSSPLWLI
jgi:hypothetical protein